MFVDEPIDNSRYATLSFKPSTDVVIHGFAGYFDCVLYGDVTLSKFVDALSLAVLCRHKSLFYAWCGRILTVLKI